MVAGGGVVVVARLVVSLGGVDEAGFGPCICRRSLTCSAARARDILKPEAAFAGKR